ncbi:MAG: hypothetical protein AB7G13_12635, partial [Lautropia sp.]
MAAVGAGVGLGLVAIGVGAGGGGGGGGGGSTQISGTAAVGAPLANAPVEVKCRVGAGTAVSDAGGRFAVPLQGATGPCLL